MGLIDDVVTELDTNWNASVVNKPKFYKEPKMEVVDLHAIRVSDTEAQHEIADAFYSLDKEVMGFVLYGKFQTRTVAELVHSEVHRIVTNHTMSNGWWWITSHSFQEIGENLCVYICNCQQVRMVE